MNLHHITSQKTSIPQSITEDSVKKSSTTFLGISSERLCERKISNDQNRKDMVNVFKNLKGIEKDQDLVSSVGLSTVLINSLEDFKLLKDQWDNLYQKCNRSSIFSSWEWMYTWWEVYKDQFKRQLYILCFYQDGKLIGIAPFQIDSRYPQSLVQGKTLRFIGLGDSRNDRVVSQYLDFIVSPGFESIIIDAVSNYLIQRKSDWHFADFEYLLEGSLILQCFISNKSKVARQKIDYGVKFTIPETDDFESYKKILGSRWRKMYLKKDRLLTRDGEVTIETTDTLNSIKPALDQLSKMHCSRWKGKVDHCVFESPRFLEFHQKVLTRLLPQNKAFIKTLSLNNEALASYYVFSDKGNIHYYQSGFYAKRANRYSPLFILVCKEIGRVIKNKQVFDFMYTDTTDSYKKNQYAAESEKMYRLRWTPHSYRLFIFRCAKAMQTKILASYCLIVKAVKTILGRRR